MTDLPKTLLPYDFHGIELEESRSGDQWVGDCPFCGREGKLTVEPGEGLWRCWVCEEGSERGGGNAYTFIRLLHDLAFKETPATAYKALARDRRLMDGQATVEWGICRSPLTGDWLVPGYNAEAQLVGLYRWMKIDGKMRLMPTPSLGHSLHGVNLYDAKKPEVVLAEGWGDGLAIYELLGQVKRTDAGLRSTASRDSCLLATTNALAVPGESVFFQSWVPLFKGKVVTLLYDNDHEKVQCAGCRKAYSPSTYSECPACGEAKKGKIVRPAGLHGMQRVAAILSGEAAEIRFVCWGKDKEWDPARKSGFDIRDMLNA